MEIELKSAEFCLTDNHPLSLRSARGAHIICTDGTLWITIPGESDDIFLTASQVYRVKDNALVIVESIGKARFQLDMAKPSHRILIAQRCWLAIRKGLAWPLGAWRLKLAEPTRGLAFFRSL